MRGVWRKTIPVGILLVSALAACQLDEPARSQPEKPQPEKMTIAGSLARQSIDVGTPGTPVSGLLLGESPKVFVEPFGPKSWIPPDAEALPIGEVAFFSPDWTRVVRARIQDEGTHVVLPSGKEIDVPGDNWLEVDSSGTVAAIAESPDENGLFPVRVLDEAGGILATVPSPEPIWISIAREGKRIAIGSRDGVQVIGREERAVQAITGDSELGSLSEDGQWLAVEKLMETGQRLVVMRLAQDGQQVSELDFPVSPGIRIGFSRDGAWLFHVSASKLLLLYLRASPATEFHRTPPAGSEWRDGAFDDERRLAVSWIRVEEPMRRVDDDRKVIGSARIGFEIQDLVDGRAQEAVAVRDLHVVSWDGMSPQLAFDTKGRLFARNWPTAFEVPIP